MNYNIFNKKSVSPLIAVILLVVVAVVLVTVLLGWGKGFVIDSLDKTTNFQQEYSADTLTLFKAEKFVNSNLLIKDLKSNGIITITGYKILSDSSHSLLNKVNNFPEPIIIGEGDIKSIPIVQPPESKFDVQLITDENKFIDVKNVDNDAQKSFAKLLSDTENLSYGVNVVQTVDGGFGILGQTNNGSYDDITFIKLDSSGSEENTYTYDGGNGYDSAFFLVTTSDGGFGILGVTNNGSDSDIIFIKLDSSGSEENTYIYDGGNGSDYGYSLVTTSDGGFGILGVTNNGSDYDIIFIKLDSSGSEENIYIYDGGNGSDSVYSLVTTSDGGFGILGRTNNGSDYDIIFIKLDSLGSEENTYIYDSGNDYDSGKSLVTTSDGGFGILGTTSNNPDWWTGVDWGDNLLLIKLDSSLSEEFVSNLGGNSSGFESNGEFFRETSDGGFIFTSWSGGYCSYDDSTSWLVVKTDSKGRCPEIQSLPINPHPGEI